MCIRDRYHIILPIPHARIYHIDTSDMYPLYHVRKAQKIHAQGPSMNKVSPYFKSLPPYHILAQTGRLARDFGVASGRFIFSCQQQNARYENQDCTGEQKEHGLRQSGSGAFCRNNIGKKSR